jgi:type I restriction enzyme S subunit
MVNIAELPKYDSYKDSGIEWLGMVPTNWDLKKFKFCFGETNAGEVIDKSHWGEGDELLYTCKRTPMRSSYNGFSDLRRTSTTDLLLTRNGTPYVHLPTEGAIYNNVVQRVRLSRHLERKYIWYALSNSAHYLGGYGDIIESFNMSTWKELIIPIPSHAAQLQIIRFLDKKTAQIDEAVAIKEKQIELLKERKQIIIQQAVTQGLKSNVSMKVSGVDWIGEIPEHWEVIRLKHLFEEHTRRTKTGSETLFSLRMELGLVPHDDVSDKHIPNESLIDYKIVEKGQLVMNRMRAAIGIFGISKAYGLVSPDYAVFNISDEVVSEYYLTLFKLPLLGTQFRLASKGMGTGSSGFMRLYTDNFGHIKIPNPPKSEQVELMAFIDKETESTSKTILHLQSQIEKLKEYKATLINSAVTGKIKVPEVDSGC